MKDFEVVLGETPDLESPIFLEGLPGIGNVGRIVARHLISIFNATKFGDIYSTAFPHQVKNLPGGTVRLMRNELYYSTTPMEILYLTGDMQPLPTDFKSHYHMAESILDLCEQFGVRMIITIGGYGLGDDIGKKGKVFGVASSPELAARYKKINLDFFEEDPGIPIVGVAGLIPAMASMRRIDALCLLGKTSGDIKPDSEAATAVLKKIAAILDIEVDLTDLPLVAASIEKEMDDIIKRIEKVERVRPGSGRGREGYIY